ncbi:MAG: AtpZ/AtpI family protein [Sphingomonadales bacterium]|jgi:ATP synthase protein I
MSDDKSFEERLKKVRARREARQADARRKTSAAMGIGFRLSLELVVAVVVGSLLGYGLDRWLGTFPLALIVFFAIGAAAGVKNMLRAVQELSAEQMSAEENTSVGDGNNEGQIGQDGPNDRSRTGNNGGV